MKKKLNERGFHLVMVPLLIIIVGIIGFAGWYVYNANKKTDVVLDDSTKTTDPVEAAPTPNRSEYLAINEWGIRIPVAGYAYTVVSADKIQITNSRLDDAMQKVNCSGDIDGYSVNYFSVLKKIDFEAGEPAIVSSSVNGYRYGLHRISYALCLDPNNTNLSSKEVNDTYELLYKELKNAWNSVEPLN